MGKRPGSSWGPGMWGKARCKTDSHGPNGKEGGGGRESRDAPQSSVLSLGVGAGRNQESSGDRLGDI